MFKNKGKLRQKLNIIETEKMPALKPTKARQKLNIMVTEKKCMVKNQ